VAVEVLAGPVVAHRGTRVGVPGGDLDVPQVDVGVQERMRSKASRSSRSKLSSSSVYSGWFCTAGGVIDGRLLLENSFS